VVSSWAILFLTADDSPNSVMDPNVGCMGAIFTFIFGMQAAFLSLIGKMARVHHIFNNPHLRRRAVHSSVVFVGILVVLVVELAIFIAWSATEPLTWKRTVDFYDVNGYPIDSHGQCNVGPTGLTFACLFFAFHGLALMGAVVLARMVRRLPSKFQETTYVYMVLASEMQVFVITVPVTVAVFAVEIGRFVLLSSLVVVSVGLLLLFIVLPKFWLVHFGVRLFLSTETSMPLNNNLVSPASPTHVASYDKATVRHSSPASYMSSARAASEANPTA